MIQKGLVHLTAAACVLLCMLHGAHCWSLFGSSESDAPLNVSSVAEYGPTVYKTMKALEYHVLAKENATAADVSVNGTLVVPYGSANKSAVVARRDGLNSLFVSFQDQELASIGTASWSSDTKPVAFLQDYVPAWAPSTLVDTFSQLVEGNGTSGPLTKAIYDVMDGERILWVTCTGEGPGGGLAILCGLAAALNFPATGVDVITFGTPWIGFNTQFAWIFYRLISLYYFWPFDTNSQPPPPVNLNASTSSITDSVQKIAVGLMDLMATEGTMEQAILIPNLPPALPEGTKKLTKDDVEEPVGSYDERTAACYQSYQGVSTYGNTSVCYEGSPKIKSLGQLAPATPAPPSSDCPPIICKAKTYMDMSCTGFMANSADTIGSAPASLGGLPYSILHDNETNADAIVAWNATSKEAIILWKFTNESRDWITDAIAYKTDNFIKQLEADFPAANPTLELFDDPQVHRGFYGQFESLAILGEGKNNLTEVVYTLSGGEEPLFIAISGFSLGGALSELAAVWSAFKWPKAQVYTVTQGAPLVGNEDYVTMFRSTVGMVNRFQFNLDEVPAMPPLPGYVVTRNPIWIVSEGGGPYSILLQDRPEFGSGVTTWYDHWCEVFYVPEIMKARALAVPTWVRSG